MYRQTLDGSFSAVSTSILEPNIHFAALFEIYKIIIPLHRSKFKIFSKIVKILYIFPEISAKFRRFFDEIRHFRTEFDGFLSEFREICQILA